MDRLICTWHVYPPISLRTMDWVAWVADTEDVDMLIGRGPTEGSAIEDLMDQIEAE